MGKKEEKKEKKAVCESESENERARAIMMGLHRFVEYDFNTVFLKDIMNCASIFIFIFG